MQESEADHYSEYTPAASLDPSELPGKPSQDKNATTNIFKTAADLSNEAPKQVGKASTSTFSLAKVDSCKLSTSLKASSSNF